MMIVWKIHWRVTQSQVRKHSSCSIPQKFDTYAKNCNSFCLHIHKLFHKHVCQCSVEQHYLSIQILWYYVGSSVMSMVKRVYPFCHDGQIPIECTYFGCQCTAEKRILTSASGVNPRHLRCVTQKSRFFFRLLISLLPYTCTHTCTDLTPETQFLSVRKKSEIAGKCWSHVHFENPPKTVVVCFV